MEQEFLYQSPLGTLKVQLKREHIYSVAKVKKIRKRSSSVLSFSFLKHKKNKHSSKSVNLILSFLDEYFDGKKVKVKELFLFPNGTLFQQKVWRYLQKIPYGEIRTYKEVAKVVGSPGAARAVGSACARNPYLILVPCHRVVAQKGLGGFALGLPAKKWLLNHECSLKDNIY